MENIIIRNILRLIGNDAINGSAIGNDAAEQPETRIEPMTDWKWKQLMETAQQYGIGPWIADGMQRLEGDFFLQPSPILRQQLVAMQGDKEPERLKRFLLQVDRQHGLLHRMKRESLRVYLSDFINTVKNIEE